jgi:tyrosyl-tRNA synthetase
MKTREQIVDEIINRGVLVEFLPDKDKFRNRLLSADPMKIYIGADPTSTALHLSHAKNYMLLEEFRKLGHQVYVLFGSFTAQIGDPTDKATARKQLTQQEVMENVKGWVEQIKPLMDFDAKENPPVIVYNHEWLSKLTMEDVVNLAANFTVQQMLERDMFQKRMKEEKPIHLHEFLYPLMQGYDSVALDVEAELCGTDQIFNALVGRTLQSRINKKEKFVLAVNLMENPVTGELMSKSRGTGIFLNFTPTDMFGAIMAQPDEMIKVFLINNTRISFSEIDEILKMENPRDAKMKTAYEIVKIFHGEEKAAEVQEYFITTFSKKEIPVEAPEFTVEKEMKLSEFLVASKNATSLSDARRKIQQGGVSVDGEKISDVNIIVDKSFDGKIFKIGKLGFVKVKF